MYAAVRLAAEGHTRWLQTASSVLWAPKLAGQRVIRG